MRPLPPYTVRPLKRRDAPKPAAAGSIRETAETISASMRAGRAAIKPAANRERPRLKVLDRT